LVKEIHIIFRIILSMKISIMITTFIFFTLLSCQNTGDANGELQNEFLTESSAASDSETAIYGAFSEELTEQLKNYFSPEMISRLDQYVLNFNQMTTDADFEKNYADGEKLLLDLFNELEAPKTEYLLGLMAENEYWSAMEVLDELREFNGQFGPIEISCVAECTQLDFLFDLKVMSEKAKTTTGKADDDFMDLVVFIEGDYGTATYVGGFKSWEIQMNDYNGHSLIGGGILPEAINKWIQFDKTYKSFPVYMTSIRKDFVAGLSWGFIYGYSKEKVVEEYDQILALNYFTEEELKGIKIQYNEIKKGSKELQFNCETEDCDYQ